MQVTIDSMESQVGELGQRLGIVHRRVPVEVVLR